MGTNPLAIGHDAGTHDEKFNQIAPADDPDQRDNHCFQVAEAFVLEIENGQHVEGCQAHPHQQGNVKKQVESDGGADDFRQIARGDGYFAEHPENNARSVRIAGLAGLRQVHLRGNPQARRQRLYENRNEVRNHQDGDELVIEAGSASDVRGPVAGVHVPNRNKKTRPGKGKELPPKAGPRRHNDAPVHFRQGRRCHGVAVTNGRYRVHKMLSIHASDSTAIGRGVSLQVWIPGEVLRRGGLCVLVLFFSTRDLYSDARVPTVVWMGWASRRRLTDDQILGR